MANTGKAIATLLIGAAVGAAAGYILATDKERRQEDLDNLKNKVASLQERLKAKFAKHNQDLEQEIYNG
ncbi:MAG: hypothetical protein JST36_09105 [Bacteroidetes bacterium]|nr:hypothetical protein [Bacteroidota bacterium]